MDAMQRAKQPARQKALELLKEHRNGLTPYEAMAYGQRKLDSYVSDLIAGGYPISKQRIKVKGFNGKEYATVRYVYKGA